MPNKHEEIRCMADLGLEGRRGKVSIPILRFKSRRFLALKAGFGPFQTPGVPNRKRRIVPLAFSTPSDAAVASEVCAWVAFWGQDFKTDYLTHLMPAVREMKKTGWFLRRPGVSNIPKNIVLDSCIRVRQRLQTISDFSCSFMYSLRGNVALSRNSLSGSPSPVMTT
jgi:hypothetical protein